MVLQRKNSKDQLSAVMPQEPASFEAQIQSFLSFQSREGAADPTPLVGQVTELINRGESTLAQWRELIPDDRLYSLKGFERYPILMYARDFFTSRYSLVAPVTEVLDELAKLAGDRPVVELGSGTGYIASRLQLRGTAVRCTDVSPVTETNRPYNFQTTYAPIEQLDAAAATALAPPNAILLLTWPSYESNFAAKALAAMTEGQTLVYNGEFTGGCCADAEFFEGLNQLQHDEALSHALNEAHVQWPCIHDRWKVLHK